MVSGQKREDGRDESNPALYFMDAWTPATTTIADKPSIAATVSADEHIDELFSTRFADQLVEFPVFNSITSPVDSAEVIDNVLGKTAKTSSSVVKVSDAIDMSALGPTTDKCPTGPVWTISSTLRGQEMLTIFDTGAVKAAVPISTANGSRTPWTTKLPHKLSFIKADGSRYSPAGFCPSFRFRFGTVEFDIQAYVVDTAPFQQLLGTEFLWATGAASGH
ncbi:hypothetical protein EDC01DRAFT_626444 [Geopyxis carbonaria]|nr:hypothetical protein EDC01DRAFT_626444 [Geopyxis carbonaria]